MELKARQIPSLVGAGVLVGALLGVLAPRLLVPGSTPKPGPDRAEVCEREIQIRTNALVEIKEQVLSVRAQWNQLEIQLGPIGGVPSWWSSKETLETQQGRAKAKLESMPGPLLQASCEEDPCMLLYQAGETPLELGPGEQHFSQGDRGVLALPPASGPSPQRLARIEVRAHRLLSSEQPQAEEVP